MFKQREGGPIGLRASGVVAKLAMEIWLKELKMKWEKAGMEVFLLRKYVDDVIVMCRMARMGQRYNKDRTISKDFETFSHDKSKTNHQKES